ncbi:hypothetical protein HJFPF1_11165 [Paramyrothecium foliicola]|nr:hypothetical protein HJFPF1_11165 [Paramyrothecium foliicola]
MSGRSAYVRKKITETKPDKQRRDRTRSSASSEQDEIGVPDFPMPAGPVGTGVGTTNARFLKFSDPAYQAGSPVSVQSGGSSGGGSSGDPRRDPYAHTNQQMGPTDEYGYPRGARRPTIKTEDVSGIEKSGLRSMLDKRSDDVRKGIAKTFAFRKKDKEGEGRRSSVDRPPSAATVRPHHPYPQDNDFGYEEPRMSPTTPAQQQLPQHLQWQQPHTQQPQPHQYHPHYPQQMPLPPLPPPPQGPYPGSPPDAWDPNGGVVGPPPTGKLPPIPQPPIKRWIGAGRPVGRWNKLRKDPELWDPNGDVLVFLGRRGQQPRPPPSFRLSSHIIEATESRYLVTLLREGFIDDDINAMPMPPSPAGPPPPPHMNHLGHGMGRGGQPTPPVSEDASLAEMDGQISYEMYFPTPNLGRTEQLRHQLTTRNVFALLYHSSLVGLTLHQALADLQSRLETYMPPGTDNVGQIINYLTARGIDDARNDPETAIGLLAWSEAAEVRWDEGWRESFLHCAGMHTELEHCADFRHTTPITRALLERACLETQLRVQTAEERLADLSFGDMWSVASGPAWASGERLRKMLLAHYTRVYGTWPPQPMLTSSSARQQQSAHGQDEAAEEEDTWLTRTVAMNLQRDFGALYDYLVNRDIMWDVSEARSGRKWMLVSESGNRSFEADMAEMPITDMLIEFDNKLRFPHIPHPYPLIPESIPPVMSPTTGSGGFFGRKASTPGLDAKAQAGGAGGARAGAMERRVHLAYTESTNIYALGSDFTQSDLIDAFVRFEKSDKIGEVDPAIARLGRWVLIYGILQTLASVSVDAPGVRYRDGVAYHLNPRLKGTKIPPWKGNGAAGSSASAASLLTAGANAGGGGAGNPEEASHELSHCWVVPRTWAGYGVSSGAESSGGSRSASPVGGSNASATTRGGGGQNSGSLRTVWSYQSSSAPSYSVASGMSESDTASSVRTPSSTPRGLSAPRTGRPQERGPGVPALRLNRSQQPKMKSPMQLGFDDGGSATGGSERSRSRDERGFRGGEAPVIKDFDEDSVHRMG